MLSRFFSSKEAGRNAAPRVPDGQRVYAIGDIHGRFDLLKDLIGKIDADAGGQPYLLIFLGDLIDRGPQSADVVEYCRRLADERPAGSTRFLLGNHEEVFLLTLEGDTSAVKLFNRIGGRATAVSYGVSEPTYDSLDYAELLQAVSDAVPEQHARFLSSFEDVVEVGDYAFVHAGVRPGVPLTEQRVSDLRWIRDEFLNHRKRLDKIIVHGHTISDKVEVLPHRIGIDTGAYASGVLTAMGFEADRNWVLQATDI
ncbi:metallophosphoesterase family protein [Sphingomonas sp. HITSZ_GF]|uniref:metallophosphoesterase family protein n=1 Tax=Sphingomonas sp. HITSZ_GF TaxID=3037247 RepID=UPI00240E3614|nr:metallophosphoesterase family protein [Sphingomonas sp. HITSZ_GF]MDG2535759.1 metallophosphoesterase family protein [Sphingomonas sp. HITSZ_GF]